MKGIDQSGPPVPGAYRGVWRRTLLEAPGMRDTDTTVYWMQAACWHCDIRIPADRPDFSGVESLADCSEAQRAWLSRQQGFAGITRVDRSSGRETCTWRRLVDYQPPGMAADAGFMEFERTRLVETGVHADYLEHWESMPASRDGFAVLQRLNADGSEAEPFELLMVAGEYVMTVRDRAVSWSDGEAPARPALLDFETSFGRRAPAGWTIMHSTLPWREGRSIGASMTPVDDRRVWIASDGRPGLWHVHEWQPPARNKREAAVPSVSRVRCTA